MHRVKPEMRVLLIAILLLLTVTLFLPLLVLFIRSFETEQGFSLANYGSIWMNDEMMIAALNSMKVSTVTAIITTILAFIPAYTIHCTRAHRIFKGMLKMTIVLPMLLPTITYGFAMMYSLGNQGLLTKLAGRNLFDIYGFNGLLIGYVIYTLPPAFLLIHNAFKYIDKKFIIVSHLMGDRPLRSFANTIVRPLAGAVGWGICAVLYLKLHGLWDTGIGGRNLFRGG